jgi:hypothetical protein
MNQHFEVGDVIMIPDYEGKFVVESVTPEIIKARKLRQGLVYHPRMGQFSFSPDLHGVKKEGRLRQTFIM